MFWPKPIVRNQTKRVGNEYAKNIAQIYDNYVRDVVTSKENLVKYGKTNEPIPI